MTLGLLYGFGVGALLGLTGAGGGILAVPALVLGLGYDPRAAAPVALLAVGISASLGAMDGLRRRIVRWRAGLVIAAVGLACTPVGSGIARELPAAVVLSMFACLMLYIATRLLVQMRGRPESVPREQSRLKNCMLHPADGRFRWTRRCAATLTGIGGACGLMTGMLGVGGGFVIVPAFKQWTNVQFHSIVATSLFVVSLVAMGAAAASLASGAQIGQTGLFFVVASVCGMCAGRVLAPRLSARMVQTSFALLAASVALLMLHRAWLA